LKIFLFLFYNAVKLLVKISFRIFYEKVVVKNQAYLRRDNPSILVSNHPSTLTDPLQVAHKAKRMVHFLANAGLFKHPIGNWFFNTFYCIPVERPKDVSGRMIKNDESLEKAENFLCGGGLLYIAVEGYSQPERRLGKLKTGAARIALGAANKTNFQTDLTMQPVGLNYTNHRYFRSRLFTYVGEPIKVADYKKLYEQDVRSAVVQLTADMTEAMRALIIDTEDEAEDKLLRQLEEILGNSHSLDLEASFFRNKQILEQVRLYRDNFPSKDAAFRQNVQQYFDGLEQHGLKDSAVAASKTSTSMMGQGLLLLLGLPFFLYGWLNNFLANYLPLLITKKVNIFPGYDSTIKLMSGLMIYPLLYGLQIFLVYQLFHSPVITWGYFLSLAPLGLFAWWYRKRYQCFWENQEWRKFADANLELSRQLKTARAALVEELFDKLLMAKKIIA
jgi:glycerol-3-phosphate O-acyltransferase / dihydroxyacetone phosphate acyltransferase